MYRTMELFWYYWKLSGASLQPMLILDNAVIFIRSDYYSYYESYFQVKVSELSVLG